jgi:hypothetical protein
MRTYLQQNKTAFSILFIPFPGAYLDPAINRKAAAAKDAIAGWTARKGVPFLYIGPDITTPNPNEILLRDHAHFNVRGNREIASAIENHWAQLTSAPEQAPDVRPAKTTATK